MSVHDLSCGGCGGELRGLEFDVLFCCARCRSLRDPTSGDTHAISRLQSDAGADTRRVLLPFWSFGFSLTCRDAKGRPSAAAQRVIDRVRRVFVAAFAMAREDVYGDPGLIWTQRQDDLRTAALASGEELVLVGVRRAEESARAHVLPYLLTMIDAIEDITGLTADVVVRDPAILAVPWVDLGDRLLDPWSGLEFPASALDDIDGIRDTV